MKRLVSGSVSLLLLCAFLLLPRGTDSVSTRPWHPLLEAVTGPAVQAAVLASGRMLESPYLRAVDESLPPLETRLPLRPLVVTTGMEATIQDLPQLRIGHFGGNLQLPFPTQAEFSPLALMLSENLLGAPGMGTRHFYGNIVEDFQIHPDHSHFRFELRHGLRWSDGEPVTTADIQFAYEEVWRNEELNFMGMPSQFRTGGSPYKPPMTLRIQDDYVFYVSFAEEYGSFLDRLGNGGKRGYADLIKPAHHLKSAHPAYASEAELRRQLQTHGLRYRWELFAAVDCDHTKAQQPACRHFPTLWPWRNVSENETALEFERNPYYFKVDAAGHQLPYIDSLTLVPVAEGSPAPPTAPYDLTATADGLQRWSLLQEAQRQGLMNVHVLHADADPAAFHLNYTHASENWRQVVEQPDFRRALWRAVDRNAIITTVFHGFGAVPDPGEPDYDVSEANRLLDGMGMAARDAEGWRLGPDGAPFSIPIEYPASNPEFSLTATMLAEFWAAAGLKTQLLPASPVVLTVRFHDNQVQASLGHFRQPLWGSGAGTDYIPNHAWGRLWRLWYDTQGRQGEMPPPPVQRLFELHDARIMAHPDSAAEAALLDEIRAIHREHLFVMNMAKNVGYVLTAHPDLRNLPDSGLASSAIKGGELLFFDAPARP